MGDCFYFGIVIKRPRRICLLLLKSGEKKLSPLEILQNCVTPLGNFKVKNQNP